jgi:hypothetical protein
MKFYVLRRDTDPASTVGVTDFLTTTPSPKGEAPHCPLCGRATGMIQDMPPYQAELKLHDDRYGDFCFGPGDAFLISERVLDKFREADLSGIVMRGQVEISNVVKPSGRPLGGRPRYYFCEASRSRAAVDDVRSELERAGSVDCEECRLDGLIRRWKRVIIQTDTWSGEDLFIARGLPGVFLTSEAFKKVCDVEQFSNCKLTAAEDYARDFYPWERPTPV